MEAQAGLKKVRVFVSSPGDVTEERIKAEEIFNRLQAEFGGVLLIEPYFWEHEPMRAHSDFQSQIEPPSRFDIFICLLWSRLGTRLCPEFHRKPSGDHYASGTELELLDALESYKQKKIPEVFIYRRTADPVIPVKPKGAGERVLTEYWELQSFLSEFTQRDGHFIVGTNSYQGLDQFEAKFEADMRKVFQGQLPAGVAGSRALPRTWTRGSPFRGLLYFDFDHAPVFCGRTRDVHEVLDRLRRQAAKEASRVFVLVVGSSGVGKSSLVRAGVLPLLIKPGIIDGVGVWRRAVMRPSESLDGDLFGALARALCQKEALPELEHDGTDVLQVAKMLGESPDGVNVLIRRLLFQAAREARPGEVPERLPRALCALVVDQLEELFTVEALAPQREGFLRALDALASSGEVWVLATLRSDFYPRCEESPLLMKLKADGGSYHLPPPDGHQLGQMIRRPAAAAGLLFGEDHETGRRLDDILRDAAMASANPLPLLEFALEELFLRRDPERGILQLETYHSMGGVEGALGKRAEESYLSVSLPAQASFTAVFRKLVTIRINNNSPAVRSRALKDELDADAASRELVERLIADRLLVADGTEETAAFVSVAHEEMLKSWPRLQEWIVQHRETLRNLAEVSVDCQRWLESHMNPDFLCLHKVLLGRAKVLLDTGFLDPLERKFVEASLRKVAQLQFQSCLADGEGMTEKSAELRAEHPEVRREILLEVISAGKESARLHAATLLGMDPVDELTSQLVEVVLEDPADGVREAAAVSLVRLDRGELFERLVSRLEEGNLREVVRSLAYVRAAADAVEEPTSFEKRFWSIKPRARSGIVWQSRLLRLRHGWPTLLIAGSAAVLPASVFSALFKAFPGTFNYALCQPKASAPTGSFNGFLACVFWGGIITLALTLHRVVFRSELGRKSFLRPATAIIAGAIGGFISSTLILMIMTLVCEGNGIIALGWTKTIWQANWNQYWTDILWETRLFWPYMIMGLGLGIGMGLMSNGVYASKEWKTLMSSQSELSGRSAVSLLGNLIWCVKRYAWPLFLCMAAADLIAFYVLRHAPGALAPPLWMRTWGDIFLGGRRWNEQYQADWNNAHLREWKMSAWAQGLGIFFDSATQTLGAILCIAGMAWGLIATRFGLRIEPRKV